jgi:hypothetical protein
MLLFAPAFAAATCSRDPERSWPHPCGMLHAAGAAMKLLYDALLYRAFRRVRPPEEVGLA